MSPGFEILLFGLAFGAATLGGVLGMASGIFIVPLLTLFCHIDIHAAIGASIVSVIACSTASAAPFLERRLTNIRLAVVLEVATTLGALTGVFLNGRIPVTWLYALFAFILALSAIQMLSKRKAPAPSPVQDSASPAKDTWVRARLSATYPDSELGREVAYPIEGLPLGLSLMYGAGLISALLGIGSGVLKIPAMDTALRLPIKVSSATSSFMIGVTATASAGAYFIKGDIAPSIAGPVVLGSVVGAMLGAWLLMRVSSRKLRLLFAFVLIALAVQMLLTACGVGSMKGNE